MRRIVVSMITSLDGYAEGPGRDVGALPFDDGFSERNLELLEGASAMLLGRRGFEGFTSYWPQVQHDESQPETERAISRLNTAMEKVVISDSLDLDQEGDWGPVRVVRRADAAAAVRELREGDGGDVVVFGGVTTWNPLLEQGLVDELQVLVGPALLGGGTPLFTGDRVPLRLLEARVLPDSQLVLLRYAPERGLIRTSSAHAAILPP